MSEILSIEVEDKILEALDHLAHRTARSRGELVTQALQDYLGLQAWQLGKIEAGIAAADRDEFATDEELARIAKKHSRPE
jgi:predicted transcriptional regulator